MFMDKCSQFFYKFLALNFFKQQALTVPVIGFNDSFFIGSAQHNTF